MIKHQEDILLQILHYLNINSADDAIYAIEFRDVCRIVPNRVRRWWRTAPSRRLYNSFRRSRNRIPIRSNRLTTNQIPWIISNKNRSTEAEKCADNAARNHKPTLLEHSSNNDAHNGASNQTITHVIISKNDFHKTILAYFTSKPG